MMKVTIRVIPLVAEYLQHRYSQDLDLSGQDIICKYLKASLHHYQNRNPYKGTDDAYLSHTIKVSVPSSLQYSDGHSMNKTANIQFNRFVRDYILDQFAIFMHSHKKAGLKMKDAIGLARIQTCISNELLDDNSIYRYYSRSIYNKKVEKSDRIFSNTENNICNSYKQRLTA